MSATKMRHTVCSLSMCSYYPEFTVLHKTSPLLASSISHYEPLLGHIAQHFCNKVVLLDITIFSTSLSSPIYMKQNTNKNGTCPIYRDKIISPDHRGSITKNPCLWDLEILPDLLKISSSHSQCYHKITFCLYVTSLYMQLHTSNVVFLNSLKYNSHCLTSYYT